MILRITLDVNRKLVKLHAVSAIAELLVTSDEAYGKQAGYKLSHINRT